MKLKILFVLLMILLSLSLFAEKIATVYSDFRSYTYKTSHVNEIKALGYEHVGWENTQFEEFIKHINEYKAVIFCPVYNYTNSIDISKYNLEIFRYLQNGGYVFVTDVNYEPNYSWLAKLGSEFLFESGKTEIKGQEEKSAIFPNHHHPLLDNIEAIGLPWCTAEKVSPYWNVLALDTVGNPSIVYQHIGKGYIIVSTSYIQQGFPSAQFLKNVFSYDGSKSWIGFDNISNFIKINKTPSPAKGFECLKGKYIENIDWEREEKIKAGRGYYKKPLDGGTLWSADCDDFGIHFKVVCEDPDLINTTVKTTERDGSVWNDDCVEIYITPSIKKLPMISETSNGKDDYYYFGVNCLNIMCDAKNTDISYNTYAESKITQDSKSWTLDIYIPYSSIGADEKTETFAFNIVRVYHPSKSEAGIYSAKNISRENLVVPMCWNRFEFEKPIKFTSAKNFDFEMQESIQVGEKANITFPAKGYYGVKNLNTGETVKFSNTDKGNILLKEAGTFQFMAVKYDGAKGGITVSSPIKTLEVKDCLDCKVIYPYYRNIVQSKDPDKTMRIECSVPELKGKFSVSLSVSKDNRTVLSANEVLVNSEKKELKCDLSQLKEGTYSYTIVLKNDKNQVLRTVKKEFKVLAPASFEVTFDRKRVCYVNGEPFFPIGLYHAGPVAMGWLNEKRKPEMPELTLEEIYKDVADHGFNIAMTQDNSYPKTSDTANEAKKNGLIYNYEIGPALDRTFLGEITDANNANSTGLFYYTVDEPINEKLQSAISMYKILSEKDPHRPCGAAVCFPGVFRNAVQAFDIMMPDTYLYRANSRTPSLSGLLEPIQIAMEACNGQKPLWAVPQAFGWGGNTPSFTIPAKEDLRCQMYFYLVYGATGFCWYGYTSPEDDPTAPYGLWHLPSSDLWDYFKVLNREMKEFAPVIFYGESTGALKGNNEKVHSNVWERDGKHYGIIVNPEREAQTVTYEIAGEIKPYFKDYRYSIKQNGSSAEFALEPLECVIIEYCIFQ